MSSTTVWSARFGVIEQKTFQGLSTRCRRCLRQHVVRLCRPLPNQGCAFVYLLSALRSPEYRMHIAQAVTRTRRRISSREAGDAVAQTQKRHTRSACTGVPLPRARPQYVLGSLRAVSTGAGTFPSFMIEGTVLWVDFAAANHHSPASLPNQRVPFPLRSTDPH